MGLRRTNRSPCGHDERDLHQLADAELADECDDGGQVAASIRGRIAQCPTCRHGWDRLITMRRLLVAATVAADGPYAPRTPDHPSARTAGKAMLLYLADIQGI